MEFFLSECDLVLDSVCSFNFSIRRRPTVKDESDRQSAKSINISRDTIDQIPRLGGADWNKYGSFFATGSFFILSELLIRRDCKMSA